MKLGVPYQPQVIQNIKAWAVVRACVRASYSFDEAQAMLKLLALDKIDAKPFMDYVVRNNHLVK